MAATQAKKIAKNPPAAAKDITREMTTALTVAATKKSIKTNIPANVRKMIVPTCNNYQHHEKSRRKRQSRNKNDMIISNIIACYE